MMTVSATARNKMGNLNFTKGCWVIGYMGGMTILSYLSSFGGRNMIPFGIDFIIMANFTLCIYLCAYTCVNRTKITFKKIKPTTVNASC